MLNDGAPVGVSTVQAGDINLPLLPQFQSDDRDFQLMQNSWGAILNPVIVNNGAIGTLIQAQRKTAATLTTTNTIYNLCNLVVPKGVWLLWSFVSFPALPANTTQTITMMSTSPTTQSGLEYDGSTSHLETNTGASLTQPCGPFPVTLRSTTTYYLNVRSVFTGSAPTALGTIYGIQLGVI